MDKETLSNYGWIVICVLVLSVMLALATPFGKFIETAVKSTTQGLFDVNHDALGAAGIDIEGQVFPCDHTYENDRCTKCGALDPNHTHTFDANGNCTICGHHEHKYPTTGLTAVCQGCGEVKEHECEYGDDNFCDLCGEEKVVEYAFKASNYDALMGTTTKTDANVVIPETFTAPDGTKYRVTSIYYDAFWGCRTLTSVTIPNSVTNIGGSAFAECSSLTNITIPASVTSIDNSAFIRTYFTEINVDESNPNFCSINGVLYNKTQTELVRYPQEKTDTSFTVPDTVTSIIENAFFGCTSLTSIGPVGSGASVEIPDSVTSIDQYAFELCGSLTSVTIPASVTEIGHDAFQDCRSLENVTISNNVTEISEQTFANCNKLTSITIPASVETIGDRAFCNCTSLTSITFNGTQAQWNTITKGENWKMSVPSSCVVHCTDGDIAIADAG